MKKSREYIETISNVFSKLPNDVRQHCLRTEKYVRILTRAFPELAAIYPGMTFLQLEKAMGYGGKCHDLGKTMCSNTLLHQPEKLTSLEWKIIKSHSQRAVEILEEDQDFAKQEAIYKKIVTDCCLYHHERYGGSGYPKGMKAEEIPVSSQIVAVCDVLDALTSFRPYKKTMSFEQAMVQITETEKDKFSPLVLERMKMCSDELRYICCTNRLRY